MKKLIIIGLPKKDYVVLCKFIEVIREANRLVLPLADEITDQFDFSDYSELGIDFHTFNEFVLKEVSLRGTLVSLKDVVIHNSNLFLNVAKLHPDLKLRYFHKWTPKEDSDLGDEWQQVGDKNLNNCSSEQETQEWLRSMAIIILRDFLG